MTMTMPHSLHMNPDVLDTSPVLRFFDGAPAGQGAPNSFRRKNQKKGTCWGFDKILFADPLRSAISVLIEQKAPGYISLQKEIVSKIHLPLL